MSPCFTDRFIFFISLSPNFFEVSLFVRRVGTKRGGAREVIYFLIVYQTGHASQIFSMVDIHFVLFFLYSGSDLGDDNNFVCLKDLAFS